jgi:mono/diheme cytochrome c family protein
LKTTSWNSRAALNIFGFRNFCLKFFDMKTFFLLRFFLFVALLGAFVFCKNDADDDRVFSPKNIESEYFKIKAGKDTTLVTKQGVVIEIPAQAFFRREPNATVTLEVKTALTLDDMILGGLSTVDSSGSLLESGGMVFMDAEPRQPINPDFPIRVKIPAESFNPAMRTFRLSDEKNPSAGWIETAPLANAENLAAAEKGQQLFATHCKSCHSDDFRQPMTGPPLGNIHLYRSATWLRAYTRNSQKMTQDGDPIASCLWTFWKPVLMPPFPQLTDEEIDAIYTYTASESVAQGIMPDEISDIVNCLGHIEHSEAFVATPRDSFIVPVKFYELQFREFGWVNVDFFPEDLAEVEPFEISVVKPELARYVEIIVAFNRRKIVMGTLFDGGFHRLMGSSGKSKIRLPLGEQVRIIGSGRSPDGKYWFGEMDAEVGEMNQLTLTFRESSKDELYKYVKVPILH